MRRRPKGSGLVFHSNKRRGVDSILLDQIREYCEEALVIADKHGVHEGLSYLIGKKFCRVLHSLRETQNKTKFLYTDQFYNDERRSLPNAGQELDYALAQENNYRELREEIGSLTLLRDDFVREIRACFEMQDIEDYLNGYPRLDFLRGGQESSEPSISSNAVRMDKAEIFLEVDDIFLVEEIKKLFN